MTKSTRKWIRAGMETFIHGGTSAITATITVNVIDPKDWGASWKSLQLAGMCFLFNGGFRFVQWWSANPLPPEESDTTISLNLLKPALPRAIDTPDLTKQPQEPITK